MSENLAQHFRNDGKGQLGVPTIVPSRYMRCLLYRVSLESALKIVAILSNLALFLQ